LMCSHPSEVAKRLLTPDRAAELGRRLDLGESKAALAREFGWTGPPSIVTSGGRRLSLRAA
jgi:hypothetical protein